MSDQSTVFKRFITLCAAVSTVVAIVAVTPTVTAAAAPATSAPATGAITLHVESARTVNAGPGFVHDGAPIGAYKWLINVDDTGDPGTIRKQLAAR